MTDSPFRYGFVGAGRRANILFRVLAKLPEKFTLAGTVVRSAGSKDKFEKEWNKPAYFSVDELLKKEKIDALVSTAGKPREERDDFHIKLLDYAIPVLFETPPAWDAARLKKLWEKSHKLKTHVEVAEQYILRPYHQITRQMIDNGLLGKVHYADVSIAHGYHGISLIRHYLTTGLQLPDKVTGFVLSDKIKGKEAGDEHAIAVLEFPEGKTGLFNFSDFLYGYCARNTYVRIRGINGEISDYDVAYTEDGVSVLRSPIVRDMSGSDNDAVPLTLRGLHFENRFYWKNPYAGKPLTDEEIAIAESLGNMAKTVVDGKPRYSLQEGIIDRFIDIMIDTSQQKGGAVKKTDFDWRPE